MTLHLYLSVIPEALIVSMLPPRRFGRYYSIGTRQRSRGQALFFEIDPAFSDENGAIDAARSRCVPHRDGTPKNSVYASIYRALEHVPLAAFGSLFLSTDDGRVLELERTGYESGDDDALHLYQECCPVTPRVVSTLDPPAFSHFITRPDMLISLPRLVFCELELDELATDPARGRAPDLPYPHMDHLRDCLLGLRAEPEKGVKMVMRNTGGEIQFRTVHGGFFVGDATGLLYYPMPSREALEEHHRAWWRSAQMAGMR